MALTANRKLEELKRDWGPRGGLGTAAGWRSLNYPFDFWKLPEQLRAALAGANLLTGTEITKFLFEEYLPEKARRPPRSIHFYYRFKNLIPKPVRHRLNRAVVRMRPARRFPNWPCEDTVLNLLTEWLDAASGQCTSAQRVRIGLWPTGCRCCVVLTHDVDSAQGMAHVERMAELEAKYGLRSAWNLPLAQYRIDWSMVERLRRAGFEFGAHGLDHRGALFRTRHDFEQLSPTLLDLGHEHGLCGFRAPSTLRRLEWIEELGFDHDSSLADTDPFEPQGGGACTIFPFFIGQTVELPYTLPQDHTLVHVLRRDPLAMWTDKAGWIAARRGMILSLVHPDYCGEPPLLGVYEEFLKYLKELDRVWYALPSEVADWWRRRALSTVELSAAGPPRIDGPAAFDGVLETASLDRRFYFGRIEQCQTR